MHIVSANGCLKEATMLTVTLYTDYNHCLYFSGREGSSYADYIKASMVDVSGDNLGWFSCTLEV